MKKTKLHEGLEDRRSVGRRTEETTHEAEQKSRNHTATVGVASKLRDEKASYLGNDALGISSPCEDSAPAVYTLDS